MDEMTFSRYRRTAVLMPVLFLAFAAGDPGLRSQTEAAPSRGPVYRIQPEDVLEVHVWREQDLTRTVTVRSDGRISLPLIQDLPAADLTPEELQVRIAEQLKKFVSAPVVAVIVQPAENFVVFVTGNVERPGLYRFRKPVTVLQALALAGGFQDYAKDDEMTILRTLGNQHIVFDFNYREVIKGRKPEQNIILRSGDVVIVP